MFHLVLGSLVEIRIGFYWLIPVTEDDPAYNPPYRFKVMERVIVEGPGWIILDQWQETISERFILVRHQVKCSLISSINHKTHSIF